jgi:rubredoxin
MSDEENDQPESEPEEPQEDEPQPEITLSKWICPQCGHTRPFVKEINDKSRPPIIMGSALAPMYHKKMQCSHCSYEWVPEE